MNDIEFQQRRAKKNAKFEFENSVHRTRKTEDSARADIKQTNQIPKDALCYSAVMENVLLLAQSH